MLGGVLARAGWSADDIGHLVGVVARAADDREWRDRADTAAGAVAVKANGHDVSGLGRLRDVWGPDVRDTLCKWLGWQELRAGSKAAGFEDAIALKFAEQHAEHFRYVAASSQWMRWTGLHWQTEDTLAAFDESRMLCRKHGDADAKKVAAVVTLARSDRRIAATTEQWNRNPWAFNTGEQK